MADYYQTLGVPRNATEAEVKELKSAQCPYEDDAQAILDGISPEYVVQGGSVMGTLAASVVKLEAQVKTLTAQLERYEKLLEQPLTDLKAKTGSLLVKIANKTLERAEMMA